MNAPLFPEEALRVTAHKLTFRYLEELCAVKSIDDDVVVVGRLTGFELREAQIVGNSKPVADVTVSVGNLKFRVKNMEQIVFPNLTKVKPNPTP